MVEKINRNLILAEYQIMETERLVLRPIILGDEEDMFGYASDKETVEFVFPIHETVEDSRKNIADFFLVAPLGKYGIALKETGKMVGVIHILVDDDNYKREIGYAINKKFFGTRVCARSGSSNSLARFQKTRINKNRRAA